MAIAAVENVREWLNHDGSLIGQGNPLTAGVFTQTTRSPADGAYALVTRAGGGGDVVAEQDPGLTTAGIAVLCFGNDPAVAERAATAVATKIENLTGLPEPCGDSDVWVLVSDQLAGPTEIPISPDAAEGFCYQVTAALVLAEM